MKTKRLVSVFFCLILYFSLFCSCGQKNIDKNPKNTSAETFDASVFMLVSNKGSIDTSKILSEDIASASMLTDTYATIIKSDAVLDNVAEILMNEHNLAHSADKIRENLEIRVLEETEIIEIIVHSTDEAQAKLIANTIAEIAPEILESYTNATVKVIEYADAYKE